MSKHCTSCGEPFADDDTYCSKCGSKRISDKEYKILNNLKNSVFKVLVFQVIFFFIYPLIYFRNILTKIKKENTFLTAFYHLFMIGVLIMIGSFLLRYIGLVVDKNPSEEDYWMIMSNVFFVGPYAAWFYACGTVYIVGVVITAKRLNRILPPKNRLNYFLSLVFGPFYFQIKINKLAKNKSKPEAKSKNPDIDYPTIILVTLGLVFATLFTATGIKMFSYLYIVASEHEPTLQLASMDYSGKQAYADSNPNFVTMDEVAAICKNEAEDLSYGCNVQNGDDFKIYISKVNEPTLKGIEVYSAAHEMLHTVYGKLSSSPFDKDKIDKDLEEALVRIKASGDTMTINALKPYEGEEKSVLLSEIHSIAVLYNGELPPGLEAHYKKYFKARSELSAQYRVSEGVLINAENKVVEFDASLKRFESNLNNISTVLQRQRSDLNYYSRQGNVYGYNNLVRIYNSNVDLYNSNYTKYGLEFDNYEKVYQNYESLYSSLRRNTTLQQASQIQTTNYSQAK